jgi:LPXTG-motif cell wall-anchored protein
MAVRITRAGVALTVGIIILTGLLIGGLFWVRQSGEQARRDEAVKIAEQNLEDQSGNDVALNEGDASKDEASNGDKSNTTDSEKTDNTSDTSTEDMPSTGAGTPEDADELPQTGTADVAPFIALGLITFAGVSYYRSRRTLLEL